MSEAHRSSSLATALAALALALSVFLLVRHMREGDARAGPAGIFGGERAADSSRQDNEPEVRSAPTMRSAHVAGAEGQERRELVAQAIAELTERIVRLEQRLAQMQGAMAAVGGRVTGEPAPEPPRTREEIAAERVLEVRDARGVILDPAATEQQKLDAWGDLRHLGEDAWDAATVAEMIRIGQMSTDPDVRADVWRQADADSRSDALVPALLQALAQDAHPQAREEAAETLANYLDSPQVRMALEAAAAGDTDEGVRRQASNSLRGGR